MASKKKQRIEEHHACSKKKNKDSTTGIEEKKSTAAGDGKGLVESGTLSVVSGPQGPPPVQDSTVTSSGKSHPTAQGDPRLTGEKRAVGRGKRKNSLMGLEQEMLKKPRSTLSLQMFESVQVFHKLGKKEENPLGPLKAVAQDPKSIEATGRNAPSGIASSISTMKKPAEKPQPEVQESWPTLESPELLSMERTLGHNEGDEKEEFSGKLWGTTDRKGAMPSEQPKQDVGRPNIPLVGPNHKYQEINMFSISDASIKQNLLKKAWSNSQGGSSSNLQNHNKPIQVPHHPERETGSLASENQKLPPASPPQTETNPPRGLPLTGSAGALVHYVRQPARLEMEVSTPIPQGQREEREEMKRRAKTTRERAAQISMLGSRSFFIEREQDMKVSREYGYADYLLDNPELTRKYRLR
ncbi:uncharacterized protein C2orf78 [Latimeria chalumnae]|uniref:uncharacterized protein C2orf78 n=1 Tax=Latimeria chalumnae TaxID=7897 RepID=UPI00313BA99B